MTKPKFLRSKSGLGVMALTLLFALLVVPFVASAAGNRVYYSPVASSFVPAGSFGGDIPEGGGNGINKLTINAGPTAYDVYFTINNTNNGTVGTTYIETRKGPGNVDLSGNVSLSTTAGDFTNATNSTYINFTNATTDVPLYVKVHIPPCGSDGTFRIQAHPGGSAHQGNGPGVVVFLNCNGYVPPTPTPTPTPTQSCYDYFGNPIACP